LIDLEVMVLIKWIYENDLEIAVFISPEVVGRRMGEPSEFLPQLKVKPRRRHVPLLKWLQLSTGT
jgi:hypothetical protein